MDLIKSFCLKVHSNFLRKAGVNKLKKKLRDTGTVDRRLGSGKPRSARTEENVEQLMI